MQKKGFEGQLAQLDADMQRYLNSPAEKEVTLRRGRKLFTDLVSKECSSDRYALLDSSAVQPTVTPAAGAKDPFYGILEPTPTPIPPLTVAPFLPNEDKKEEVFQKPTPTPSIQAAVKGKVLVRQITEGCKSAIDRALTWDPNLVAGICNLYGNYSPKCIEVLRVEQKERQGRLAARTPNSEQGSAVGEKKIFRSF
jgi:hypothetical protein